KDTTKVKIGSNNLTYEGLVPKVQRVFLAKDTESAKGAVKAFIERVATFATCPSCKGARLNLAALASLVNGYTIAECSAMQISDLASVIRSLSAGEVAPLAKTLLETLDSMIEVGLGYLSLDRESGSLSGGEAQRVKMVRHLG